MSTIRPIAARTVFLAALLLTGALVLLATVNPAQGASQQPLDDGARAAQQQSEPDHKYVLGPNSGDLPISHVWPDGQTVAVTLRVHEEKPSYYPDTVDAGENGSFTVEAWRENPRRMTFTRSDHSGDIVIQWSYDPFYNPHRDSLTTTVADGDIQLTWAGEADRLYCRRIDRGRQAGDKHRADVEGASSHTFENVSPGAYTCTLSADAYYLPAYASACDPEDYDRAGWGSYPPVPEGATAKWSTAADNLNDNSLEHDHHVSLKAAHSAGGCGWSEKLKDQFSSYGRNLNPTAASFNASKGSRTTDELTGIAKRVIDTDGEKCAYARQHARVKRSYGLVMTPAEKSTTEAWMNLCR